MNKEYLLLFLLALLPLVISANYYPSTIIMSGNGSASGSNYTLDISGDSGTGVILDVETFSILGANGISTSISGDTLTITKVNHTIAESDPFAYNGSLQPNITAQDCSGSDKFSSFSNGIFVCTPDNTGGTGGGTQRGSVQPIFNDSDNYYYNISWHNESIDVRANYTSADGNITISSGKVIRLIADWFNTVFAKIADITTMVGNWSGDKVNYPTNTDLQNNITNANTSMKNYVDTTFLKNNTDLNVRKVNATNATFNYLCFNNDCTSYIYYNGSHTIIKT